MTRWNAIERRFGLGPALAISMMLGVAALGSEPAAEPKKAEDVFKNIQALKGTPADQVVPAMQFIAASLGVDCDHCHVRGGREKDDLKAKQTARKMIGMVLAINRDHFAGHREVTCFTCHRGGAEPVGIPAVAQTDALPDEDQEHPEAAASLPAARSILDRYVQALGGAEALSKITTRVWSGTLVASSQPSHAVDVFAKAPNKRASYVHLSEGDSVTAFDGHSGWLGSPGRPPRDMSAPEAQSAGLDAEMGFPARIQDSFQELQVSPADKIGGREVVLVTGRNEGRPPVRMYFDAQTGLLARVVRYVETPLGRNPTQIDYDDYRTADGIRVPFKWTLARPGGRFTIQVDTVKQNVEIGDSKFEKPAEEPAKSAH